MDFLLAILMGPFSFSMPAEEGYLVAGFFVALIVLAVLFFVLSRRHPESACRQISIGLAGLFAAAWVFFGIMGWSLTIT